MIDTLGSDTNELKKEKIRISDNHTLSEMLRADALHEINANALRAQAYNIPRPEIVYQISFGLRLLL
jgi:hypothetical protein